MEINGTTYTVGDLMRNAVIIPEGSTLRDAIHILIETKSNIGCLVDKDGKLVGGVSTLDVIRAVLPDYIESDPVAARFANMELLKEDVTRSAEKLVIDFVDRNDATAKPNSNLVEEIVVSSRDCNGRIIVIDDEGKPIGILSRTEIKQVIGAFLGIKDELKECYANKGNCCKK